MLLPSLTFCHMFPHLLLGFFVLCVFSTIPWPFWCWQYWFLFRIFNFGVSMFCFVLHFCILMQRQKRNWRRAITLFFKECHPFGSFQKCWHKVCVFNYTKNKYHSPTKLRRLVQKQISTMRYIICGRILIFVFSNVVGVTCTYNIHIATTRCIHMFVCSELNLNLFA